ncbi:MAG TPA: bifunctional nuclease family protein [Paludibacter sp.]|nr:bifunctional nuclease family protein [Paludibacter sp.]
MNSEIKLMITGLVYNQTIVGTYGLVLSEEFGNRRFSVMIGEPEAQSIALKINNKKSPRPLTHDLIKNILEVLDADLRKVVIYDMVNDVFFSELHILKDNKNLIVDARTSDAVALAVRSDCPIFIKSEILDIVGTVVELDPDEKNEPLKPESDELSNEDLDILSVDELNELLDMALKEEKYELAVNIRDAIKRKKH